MTRNTPHDGDTCSQRNLALVRQLSKLKPDVERHDREIGKVKEALIKQGEALKVLLRGRDDGGAEGTVGQPDYLGCEDAEVVLSMYVGVARWLEDYGVCLGYDDIAPCWAWHPRAVVLLLATSTHHLATLAGDSPVAYTEWLTRYGDAFHDKLQRHTGMNDCTEHAHHAAGVEWAVDRGALPDLAAWWAGGHQGRPPGLTDRL